MKTKEEFLQSQYALMRKYRLAHMMHNPTLSTRVKQEIDEAYELYLNQSYNEDLPIEYVIEGIPIGLSMLNPKIPIKVDLENLSGHIISCGATGSGKSHWQLWLLNTITMLYPKTPLRFLIVASKQGCEQRSLLMNNKPGSVLYLDRNTLAVNPFYSIQNVTDELVIADSARVISNESGLQIGGQVYLQDKMIEFRQKYSDGNFIEFIKWLSAKNEKSYDYKGYKDRLVVRLRSLMYEAGNIFNCHTPIDDKHFVENNIIIELPTSSTFILSVVIGLILSRIFRYKAANQDSIQYKNILVMEDLQGAMNNIKTGQNSFKEDSIYERLVNEARYLNLTLMFIVQSALSIPSSIRQGASIIFCKRVNDREETRVLRDILNITTQKQMDTLMHLERSDGIFINKEKGCIPVSIINPPYQVKQITEQDINNHQEGYIGILLNNVIREKPHKEMNKETDNKEKNTEELDYNSTLIIQDLKRFPFDTQNERAKRLNMNVRMISETLEKLLQNNWIKKHEKKISQGKGKGSFQPYLFNEKSKEKFGKQNIKGKGSIEHSFWQFKCSQYYWGKGYNTKIEYYLDNRVASIDVVAEKNNTRIAIEIELNKTEHIKDNIQKCINERFDKIIIAVYGSQLAKYVKGILLNNLQFEKLYSEEKIMLKMLPEFLD